jgi:predicted RNA-binding protein with PUA domain
VENFDPNRARLSKKDTFNRFIVKSSKLLKQAVEEGDIKKDDNILVIERGGKHLAFSVFQMAYHHVAQGELAGEPYLVTF